MKKTPKTKKTKPPSKKAMRAAAMLEGLPKVDRDAHDERDGKVGRPAMMTRENANKVVELYALGTPETLIGPMLNPPMGRDIVAQWKARYPELKKALRDTLTLKMREDSHLGHVIAARPRQWAAAAWLLERENPGKYAMRAIIAELLNRQGIPPATPETPAAGVALTDKQREILLARARALRDADAVQLRPRKK